MEVFKGTYTNVKDVTKDVAIKIIHRELAPEVIREKFLPRELEIIQLLRHHQNIVKTILINQSNETFVFFSVQNYDLFTRCNALTSCQRLKSKINTLRTDSRQRIIL